MVTLYWKECPNHKECFKSEGAESTWYLCPTPNKKWYLSSLLKRDQTLNPEEVGIFLTIEEAMDSAQRLESTGMIHSTPATGLSVIQARVALRRYADRMIHAYKPRLGLRRLLKE